MAGLKRDIKNLQNKYSRTMNNEDVAEKVAQTSRESSACVRKRGLEQAIGKVDEDNIRLRKKLDLVKYESDKQHERLTQLLTEYEELMSGKIRKTIEKKLEHPLKKKIVDLENQLHRVSVMQMEADTVRKKYRSVRANLKADAAFYVSSLRNLEQSIKEQEMEIKQLQGVKEEAVELRDITKEVLTQQEIEAMNKSKERDNVLLDYRQRVEDRRMELERLERMIFPTTRLPPRDDDFDVAEKPAENGIDNVGGISTGEMTYLGEAFTKLRSATGVTRNEEVLDRFLGQRATKEKLQKMRTTMEEDKINLEKRRQQLTAEIEMQKFSETKDADQNAEELTKSTMKIAAEIERQVNAEKENLYIQGIIEDIAKMLWNLCDKLRDVSETSRSDNVDKPENPFVLLEFLDEKMMAAIKLMGGQDEYTKWVKEIAEKIDTLSIESTSDTGKHDEAGDERPLFPRFPGAPTPAAPPIPSEDEEEVPTRSILKRQAQLLVDTKSRRKAFNFRR
ncbi:hypothetical protein PV328_005364 [Microctonus aethiopoides]|uniref:Uncharacterized protein n=1 Tax=Microctonus aethiopoides TaxID=144406 RepID=A0AA39FM70_9HYME|nr:hypothetical protein PV328_005364 [Microctonus aethiopoides]